MMRTYYCLTISCLLCLLIADSEATAAAKGSGGHTAAGAGKVERATSAASTPSRIVDWRGLSRFAQQRGFTVTSTTGGSHNTGSAHYQGRAIDVRTRDKTPAQVERFIRAAQTAHIQVRDERVQPAGQRVWSGPHLHLQVPAQKSRSR